MCSRHFAKTKYTSLKLPQCHLAQFVIKRKEKSAFFRAFNDKCIKVVDHFHFKNHRGYWCYKNVNPWSYPILKKLANMSISEQEFSTHGRFNHCVRGLNEEHFNLYQFMLCDARQKYWDDVMENQRLKNSSASGIK